MSIWRTCTYIEKADHYKDLAKKLFMLSQKRVTIIIISIIVGSLACVKSSLDKALKDLTIEDECRSYSVYPAKDSCLASAILLYFAQSL